MHGIEMTLFTDSDDYAKQQQNNYWDEGFAMQLSFGGGGPELGG